MPQFIKVNTLTRMSGSQVRHRYATLIPISRILVVRGRTEFGGQDPYTEIEASSPPFTFLCSESVEQIEALLNGVAPAWVVPQHLTPEEVRESIRHRDEQLAAIDRQALTPSKAADILTT